MVPNIDAEKLSRIQNSLDNLSIAVGKLVKKISYLIMDKIGSKGKPLDYGIDHQHAAVTGIQHSSITMEMEYNAASERITCLLFLCLNHIGSIINSYSARGWGKSGWRGTSRHYFPHARA